MPENNQKSWIVTTYLFFGIIFLLVFGISIYSSAPVCVSRYYLPGLLCKVFGAKIEAYVLFLFSGIFFIQLIRTVFFNHKILIRFDRSAEINTNPKLALVVTVMIVAIVIFIIVKELK